MAADHQAINLGQGFPDFPVSEKLIDLIHQKMKEGHNQYAPMPGALALRKVIAAVVEKTYGRPTDSDTEVTVMAGGTEGIFASIAALVGPGDEVIVFDPSYDSYGPAIRLNGGVPVHINLLPPDFKIDWQEVERKVTARTRMIMVNTPHNPLGTILDQNDLRQLELLAVKYDLLVLSDEVYERIIFENQIHQSVLRSKILADRSIAVFSFGKTFHATGWKIGYTVACEKISREIKKTHQFITFSVNTPVQLALAEYMQDEENFVHLGKFYQAKRDYFLQAIQGTSLRPLTSLGSYFQLLSFEGVSSRTDKDMAEWMTREMGLACIPVSAFYKDGSDHRLLRFCFAKGEETLLKSGEILRKI